MCLINAYNTPIMKDEYEVKKLRNQRKLSQQEFADLMRVDVGTVSRWERGKQKPRPLHLRKMDRLRRREK